MKNNFLPGRLCIIVLFASFNLLCQIDFNNFTTTQSSGTIPEDFTKMTYEKLIDDLATGNSDLSKSEQKVFFEGINYAIDDLLHSGLVLYGDEMTQYINDIASHLLKIDKPLRSELRFYVIKSNSVNAFSTNQGIVFVTTGLLSQITNEAQLAFILSHEIAHYQSKHVLETFQYKQNRRNQSIETLSLYSKEKEFEADLSGLSIYQKAGYSRDEVLGTFDVLMYSYLPFDEIEITLDYFASRDSTYLPPYLFPEQPFEIKAVEDENDNKSSHPNIKKRKDTISLALSKLSNWGSNINHFGDDRFFKVRNIARFESIRNYVLEGEYANAVYGIYLLEKQFPESLYLKRMKAQSWLGILMYKLENRISKTVNRNSELEGYGASVHYFIKKLKSDELKAMVVRQIYDAYSGNTDDKELELIWKRTVRKLVYDNDFDRSRYSTVSFESARIAFEKTKAESGDTLQVEVEKEKLSKYDRIKKKRDIKEPDNFDTTNYYYYLIPDIINSESFNALFDSYKVEFDQKEKEEAEFNALSRTDQRKVLKKEKEDELKLGIRELIIVEPTVLSYKQGSADRVKSEKLAHNYYDVIQAVSDDSDLSVYNINKAKLASGGTTAVNERNLLLSMIHQLSNNDDIDPFPVDYQLLQQLKTNYGTDNVLFSVVEHSYSPDINYGSAALSVFLYPFGLIYFPVTMLSGNRTEINMVILDIDEGNVKGAISHYINDNLRTHTLGAHVYSIFSQIKQSK